MISSKFYIRNYTVYRDAFTSHLLIMHITLCIAALLGQARTNPTLAKLKIHIKSTRVAYPRKFYQENYFFSKEIKQTRKVLIRNLFRLYSYCSQYVHRIVYAIINQCRLLRVIDYASSKVIYKQNNLIPYKYNQFIMVIEEFMP